MATKSSAASNSEESKKESRWAQGYDRVIASKLERDCSALLKIKIENIPKSSKDIFFGLFSDKYKEDRKLKSNLSHYRNVLTAELKVIEKAKQTHLARKEALVSEFMDQENQLIRWGLLHMMRKFKIQAWLRLAQRDLLVEMCDDYLNVTQNRINSCGELVARLEKKDKKGELKGGASGGGGGASEDMSLKLPEEILMLENPDYVQRRRQLLYLDKYCNICNLQFRSTLPELNSMTGEERKASVLKMLVEYQELIRTENDDNSSSVSWEEFCSWYDGRLRREREINARFKEFVDDEREREGRLFNRWSRLVLYNIQSRNNKTEKKMNLDKGVASSSALPNSNADALSPPVESLGVGTTKAEEKADPTNDAASSAKGPVQGTESGGTAGAANAFSSNVDLSVIHAIRTPKCIKSFIRYLAINVLAVFYDIPGAYHSTLLVLVETFVHSAIAALLHQYADADLLRKDKIWSKKCYILKYANPSVYGLLPKYLPKSKVGDSSVSNQAQQNDVVIDEKQAALFVHNPVGGEEVGVTASKEVTLKPVSSFESFNNEQNFSKAVEEETDDVIAPLRGSAASASTKSGIPVAIPYTSSLSSSSSSIQGPVSKASTKRKVRSKDLIDRFTSDYFLDPTLRMSKCLSYTFDLKSLTSEDGKSQGERQSSPTPRIQAPYAYAARLLSYLQSSISPREMTTHLLSALKWLLRRASDISGSNEVIGADAMFPILISVLCHSEISSMHRILNFLSTYGPMENAGEAAYYITSMGAAIDFIEHCEVPADALKMASLAYKMTEKQFESRIHQGQGQGQGQTGRKSFSSSSYASGPVLVTASDSEFFDALINADFDAVAPQIISDLQVKRRMTFAPTNREAEKAEEALAMQKLGMWLHDQQVMEDTMVIMMQEGWVG